MGLTITDKIVDGPPFENHLFWFKADAGITKVVNGVTDWADQWPNHWDVHCVNGFSVPLPANERPVFTPNAINGLPGLLYTDPGAGLALGTLNHVEPPASNIPTAPDAPKTILALVKRTGTYGGAVVSTYQGALEFHHWDGTGPRILFSDTANNRTSVNATAVINQPIVMEWRYYGAAASPQVRVWMSIAGALRVEMPLAGGTISAESGVNGFSIGNVPTFAFSRGFQGLIVEVVAYAGTVDATAVGCHNYLLRRGAIV